MGTPEQLRDEGRELSARRFRAVGPEVVHETVEGQTIIVNLETGNYYDLNETGSYVFATIHARASLEDAAAGLCSRYQVDRTTAMQDAQQLVGELIEEQLIVPDDAESERNGGSGARGGEPESPRRYGRPVLGKYTDMQELLLLDPVHEVDETGWPSSG